MLRSRLLGVALGLSVAFTATWSRAQGPPGAGVPPGMMGAFGGGGANNPMMILLSPSVQKELKLTEAQKTRVYSLAKTSGQKVRDLNQTIFMAGGANPQAMMAANQRLRQETDKGIGQILDDKQKERFDQIVLQSEGPLAVARPEIAARLKINQTQREYVQGILMQLRQNQIQLFISARQGAATGQFNPTQFRAMSGKLRENAVQQVGKIIDKKQKAAFNKMLGEAFDLAKLDAEAADEPQPPAADPARPTDEPKTKDDAPRAKDDAPPAETDSEKEPVKKPARRKSRTP